MKAPQTHLFKGKTIASVDWRPFDDGRGGTTHNPIIFFDDGSALEFTVEETEVDRYGVLPVYDKKGTHTAKKAVPSELTVVYVVWTESERGWGQRPDGCSVHLTMDDWRKYWDAYSKDKPKEVPNEYTFPSDPKLIVISDKKIIARLMEKKSLRFWRGDDETSILHESCKM